MVKVNIWYPILTPLDSPFEWTGRAIGEVFGMAVAPHRWGHAGVKFKNVPERSNAYFAFWPVTDDPGTASVVGEVRMSRHSDMAAEGQHFSGRSFPDRVLVCDPDWITPEHEVAAYDYWVRMAASPRRYVVTDFNCCKAVANSLSSPGFIYGMFSPYDLERWILSCGESRPAQPIGWEGPLSVPLTHAPPGVPSFREPGHS